MVACRCSKAVCLCLCALTTKAVFGQSARAITFLASSRLLSRAQSFWKPLAGPQHTLRSVCPPDTACLKTWTPSSRSFTKDPSDSVDYCTTLAGLTICLTFAQQLPPWTSHRLSSPPQADLGLPSSHTEREIITAIANLSNNLLTGAASKTLAKIKHKHPELFRSVPLYARALHLLNTCHYRSTVRTYIIELFHVPLTTQTVQELKAAADRARSQVRRTVSQAADDRKSVVQAYKLNVDSDTDDDDGTSSEEDGVVTKEVFEPVMVVRGFPGLV